MSAPMSFVAGNVIKEAGKVAINVAGEALGQATISVTADTSFVNTLMGRLSIYLGDPFRRYLQNAEESYNQIRTLATEPDLRTIIGDDGIYVQVDLAYNSGRKTREFPVLTAETLLNISHRVLIEGSGGMGKSMLMKYLFLNTLHRGTYIPVFLELRRVSVQVPGQVSIEKLVYDCMKNQGVELPEKYFRESLRMGKYLFLLDGFDEVNDKLSAEVAEKINDFSTLYRENAFIITSRPANGYEHSPFQNYTKMRSLPLSQEQAVLLVRKIYRTWTWPEDREKAEEFCRQLEETLFKEHQFFAQNPLLLSMMFLTFMRNGSIPNHEAEFYRESYDALYSRHDTHDKGNYQREFKCGTALGKEEFARLFSRFCFQSFFDQKYEFTEVEILRYLEESIGKLGCFVTAQKYLSDLRKIVCMIVEEGNVYRFSHRSFQEYFAAVYTAELTDDVQKYMLRNIIKIRDPFFDTKTSHFFYILNQIEGSRLAVNAFEDSLRTLLQKASGENADMLFVREAYGGLYCSRNQRDNVSFFVDGSRTINIMFSLCEYCNIFKSPVGYFHFNHPVIQQLSSGSIFGSFSWDKIDSCFEKSGANFSQAHVNFYQSLAKAANIPELRVEIRQWLDDLGVQRRRADERDFYKNL